MENLRFKFRAYHIEQEKMINIENLLSFSNDGDIWINENKQIPLNEFSGWASKDFKLMQYTGLFDKQGVEIYEGDIVIVENYNYHGKNPKKVMFVYYNNLTAQYCTKLEKTNFKIEDLIMENQPLFFAHSIEVIGNIYEHSHLLDNN